MIRGITRLAAIAVLVLSGAAALSGSATAVGPGTFTTITTPSHDVTIHFNSAPSAVNNLTVSGTTSLDVTSVDLVCIVLAQSGPTVQPFATGVPVSGGAFSTVASLGTLPITCRLRAVPSGVDPATAYLASYSGPVVRAYTLIHTRDAGQTVGFQVINEVGGGAVVASDAASCGVNGLLTFLLPDVAIRGPGFDQFCSFTLPSGNVVRNTANSNAPSIRVDGKNAYLPSSVSSYLRAASGNGGLQLALAQPATTVSFSRHTNGDVTVTEKSPLKRCAGVNNNTYPPTSVSCTSLVGTGVSFKRVLNIIRGAHQAEMRDSFVSTDHHKHNVSAQYLFTTPGIDTGTPGYLYPNHVNHFAKASHDKLVTGFGRGPASVLVRSDIYALSTDDQADTVAYTWSRPPSEILFSHTSNGFFAMPYVFSVPAGSSASIGFAESEAPYTADAKKLAAKAEADL